MPHCDHQCTKAYLTASTENSWPIIYIAAIKPGPVPFFKEINQMIVYLVF